MFKKLMLCRKINKFYKIFGEYIGCPDFRYKVRELTDDNLMGIGFDILEALEGYDDIHDTMTQWLNKLYIQTIF